jgi:hypothetical protein
VRGGWASPRTLGWIAAGLVMLDLASNGAYQDLGNQNPAQTFEHPAIAAFFAQEREPFRIDTRTDIDKTWQPDSALLYGLEDVGGIANPLGLADTARYWEGLGSRSSRLYDLLNVRYVIAPKDVKLDWNKFALAFDGDPDLNVYLNRSVLPRAFVAQAVQPAANHEAAWDAIHAAGFDPAALAVVEGAAAPLTGGQGGVQDIRESPGQLTLHVTVDRPAVLVVSQMWYPGWQLRIDNISRGQPLRVDYAFQGVQLDAGTHDVELIFVPSRWGLGWVVAIASAIALAAWGIIVAWRGYRKRAKALDAHLDFPRSPGKVGAVHKM